MKVRNAAWLVAPLLALTLTACVGGPDSGDNNADGLSGDDKDKGQGTVLEITDTPGSLEEFVGALEDAEPSSCKATNGGWVSEGEVTNSTDVAQNYRLYVSFMEKNDTRGLVQVDLNKVEPGKSSQWKAEAELTGEDVKCVLRVERFAADS